MRIKTTLLASTALAVLSLTSPAADAAGTFYVSIFGGANWLQDDSFFAATAPTVSADTLTFDPSADTGFIVGGAVGMSLAQVTPGLRVEAEVAYRQQNVNGHWTSNVGNPSVVSSGNLDYDQSTLSVMANVWYDFQVMGVKPYVGGGVGWARARLDGNFIDVSTPLIIPLTFEDDGFAWQVGAGVNFDISPNMQIGVGYRYFDGPTVTTAPPFPSGNDARHDVDDRNQSVLVNLTIGL